MPSDTPLHLAVASSDTDVVEMILDKGARINAVNTLGETPLHCAIKNSDKNVEMTKLLLKYGSNVNVRTNYGASPLHLAASRRCPQTIDYLLTHGANVNAIEDNGASPLHLAASGGCSQTVDYLLKYGAHVDCVYTCTRHKGYTPLHCAAEKGITEVVQLLLDSGANVDAKGEDSNTPLHIAVFRGKENIVELLLRYGATVDNQDKNGKTALRLAVENAYAYASPLPTIEDILKYRPDINNQSNRECLKIAVRGYARWFKEVVEALLRYGFSVNLEDTNNTEFLHAAFEKGYVKIVEDFLKYGANVNTLLGPSGHGKGLTPLHIAVINKQEEMANLLISNKADINARDENGKTPIFYATKNADLKLTKFLLANEANVKNSPEVLFQAVETECMEIVKVLLSYDADVNASDKYGQTALHLIALQDNGFSVLRKCMVCNPRGNEVLGRNSQVKEAIAKLLLNKGADVDARTLKGETALHFAIQNENVKVVETILEYNANVNLGTKNGDMPLCLSSLTGNVEICTMLLNKGANVNVKKNGGISALHIAAQNHHGNIVKLLLNYGARVNSQDNDGRTALHYACYNGSIETVEELLEHGSDINITSKNGCTALDDNAAGIKSFYSDLNTYDSDASDYFDADRGIYRGNITLKLIICLIVKMKTANLYVSEKNIRSASTIKCGEITEYIDLGDEDEREIQDQYLRELASMKKEKITNSNVSFYDILVKGASSLAAYMRNENVVGVSKTAKYETQFPFYASILKSQFRKGMERNKLLEPANRCFNSLFNGYTELPYECAEKILNYVSNEDLKNLIDAFEPDCSS